MPKKLIRSLKTYDYYDAKYRLSYQACVTNSGQYFMRYMGPYGKMIYGMDGVKKILYNLPDIINRPNETIFLCQSENDADFLKRFGFLTTAHSNGYDAWKKEYVKYLEGRRVFLVQHFNPDGERHRNQVMRSLSGKTKASLSVIFLIGYGDNTLQDLIQTNRYLFQELLNAKDYEKRELASQRRREANRGPF